MPDLTRETIAELRRLLEAATPGEWGWDTEATDDAALYAKTEGYEHCAMYGPDAECLFDSAYSTVKTADGAHASGGLAWYQAARANFELVAAAINALPALLAAAERGLGAGDGR